MGPTWWAELVGATANAIQKRVERPRSSQIQETFETPPTLDPGAGSGMLETALTNAKFLHRRSLASFVPD
jgi:hypothetical protein